MASATQTTQPILTLPSRSAALDWVFLVVPGLIWGASFLFIAEGLEAVGPAGVTFVRILVGFATLACVPAARRPLETSEWRGIFLLGLLWMAFPLTMFPFAEQHVSSAVTGMLNGATPLSVAVVAALLARRAPSREILVGLGVGLLGTVLVALPTLGAGRSSVSGVLMVLAAIASYGVALNLARPLQQRHGALPVIWRAQAVAVALTAPLGIPDVLAARWSVGPVLALLALGALGTALAFVLTTMAAGRIGAVRASATVYLTPGVALFLGVMARGEHVTALSVVGCAVCLGGALLIRRAQLRG